MDNQNCIFCKIVAKEIPAPIIFENDDFLCFLDINPLSAGHTLVVPKSHHRWVWDLPSETNASGNIGDCFRIAQKIALAQGKAFGTNFIISKVIGEEVAHAHVHMYPSPDTKIKADKKDFAGNAEKIKIAL